MIVTTKTRSVVKSSVEGVELAQLQEGPHGEEAAVTVLWDPRTARRIAEEIVAAAKVVEALQEGRSKS